MIPDRQSQEIILILTGKVRSSECFWKGKVRNFFGTLLDSKQAKSGDHLGSERQSQELILVLTCKVRGSF
jgi:hypothetical protein